MRRRHFIASAGLGAAAALGGCLGSQEAPPPRKSSVVSEFETNDGSLVVDLADNTWVMSRYEGTQQSLDDLNPVGVAAAAKGGRGGGGRGASGRGSGGYASAPRTTHGHAWYHGGDYADDWYEDHRGDGTRYPVTVAALGIAYLGGTARFRDDAPGPGPVPWDERYPNPEDAVEYDLSNGSDAGWYRVGAKIVGTETSHDFRWESFDLK